MTTRHVRRLALESEPPSRRELSIAVLTIYAIVVAILACEIVNHVRATETKSTVPFSRLRTQDA